LIASLAIASRRTRRSRWCTFTSTTSATNPSSVLKKNITKILAFDPVCESEVTHVLKEAVLCHFVRMLYRLVDGRQVVFLKRSLQFCNCLFFLCGQRGSGDAHMRLTLHKATRCDECPVYFNQGARRTVCIVLTYSCHQTNSDDDEQWHENTSDRHDWDSSPVIEREWQNAWG